MTQVEKSNKIISALVVCMDVVIINTLFILFALVWKRYGISVVDLEILPMLISLTVSYVLSAFFSGVILFYRRVRPDQIVRKSTNSMVLFLLLWIFCAALMDVNVVSNRYIIIYLTTTIFIIVSFRLAYYSLLKWQRKRGNNSCRVIYVGSGSNLMELYNEMALELTTGYNVVGYFAASPNPLFDAKCQYLGCGEDVVEYLHHNRIDRVYCGLPSRERDIILPIINHCEGHLIRFFSVPNFRNYCQRRVSLEMFSNVPLLTIREEPLSISINRFMKRTFDILFSFCFLITAFLPIYIIVGLITKLTSPGPIFFRQRRHGLDGKEFYMYKFRSMKVNNDSDRVQATADDPRKTKWGDFLRRTSIDELPQFLNVFFGDMSIVGPRPHMVKHTEEYSKLIKTYMVRHYIKPGVTGWAQVTGFRGETKALSDMEGRVKADIWYMEHWTFTLDLYIIYKTVANVVGGKDHKAY